MSLESYIKPENIKQFHADFDDPANWLEEPPAPTNPPGPTLPPNPEPTLPIPMDIVGGFNCKLAEAIQVTPARNVKRIHHRKDADAESSPSDLDHGYGYLVAKITSSTMDCPTIPLKVNYGAFYWVIRRNPQTNRPESAIVDSSTAMIVQVASLHRCDTAEEEHEHDAVAFFLAADVCKPPITHPVSSGPTAADRRNALARYYANLNTRTVGTRGGPGGGVTLVGDFDLWFTCDQGCCYADF
jgi:hypothetical protein